MSFTLRMLRCLWRTLARSLMFRWSPAAPSADAFLAHYTKPGAGPGFSRSDPATGMTHLYDLTINQLQVTPEAEPHRSGVERASTAPSHSPIIVGNCTSAIFSAMS